jgi:hypothetical protein
MPALVRNDITVTATSPFAERNVVVDYDYSPPEDHGGWGWRVPGEATILGHDGPPWVEDWLTTHDSEVLEKIYDNHR